MKQELEDVGGNAAQGDTRSGTSSRALHNVSLDQSLLVPGWEGFRKEAEVKRLDGGRERVRKTRQDDTHYMLVARSYKVDTRTFVALCSRHNPITNEKRDA